MNPTSKGIILPKDGTHSYKAFVDSVMFIWNQGPSFLPMQGIGRSVERFDVRTALHTLYQWVEWGFAAYITQRSGQAWYIPNLVCIPDHIVCTIEGT